MTAAQMPTAAEAATFQSQGAVALSGVFKDWVEVLRAGIERNIANPSDGVRIYEGKNGARFFGDYCNWARIPEFEVGQRPESPRVSSGILLHAPSCGHRSHAHCTCSTATVRANDARAKEGTLLLRKPRRQPLASRIRHL